MKKLIALSIAVIFASGVLVSCKSHEKCPAYSKADKTAKARI
jgi:hypothetical protein